MLGDFELGYVTGQKLRQFIGIEGMAGSQLNSSANNLPEPFVRNRKHARLNNGGMSVNGRFNIQAGDILAAANDDVLLAIDDGYIAIIINPAEVTGFKPTVLQHVRRRFRLVQITAHVGRALDGNFSDFAVGQLLSMIVQDFELLQRRVEATTGIGAGDIIGAPDTNADGVCLGHTPAGGDGYMGELFVQFIDLIWWSFCPA